MATSRTRSCARVLEPTCQWSSALTTPQKGRGAQATRSKNIIVRFDPRARSLDPLLPHITHKLNTTELMHRDTKPNRA